MLQVYGIPVFAELSVACCLCVLREVPFFAMFISRLRLHMISVFIENNLLSVYHQYEVTVFSLYWKVISILNVYIIVITLLSYCC